MRTLRASPEPSSHSATSRGLGAVGVPRAVAVEAVRAQDRPLGQGLAGEGAAQATQRGDGDHHALRSAGAPLAHGATRRHPQGLGVRLALVAEPDQENAPYAGIGARVHHQRLAAGALEVARLEHGRDAPPERPIQRRVAAGQARAVGLRLGERQREKIRGQPFSRAGFDRYLHAGSFP